MPDKEAKMIGIGINTGTSADAIDVAIVDFNDMFPNTSIKLLWSGSYPYPVKLKRLFLKLVDHGDRYTSQAWFSTMGSFDTELGIAFADAVLKSIKTYGIKIQNINFIGSHGQTVWHAPAGTSKAQGYGTTIQLGNPSVIAVRTGIPVVADFREKDVANNGQGAPLSPILHFELFKALAPVGVLNIGGIANLTIIPSDRDFLKVYGFDTGPGNRLIDIAVEVITNGRKHFDESGKLAKKGIVISTALTRLMRDPFVRKRPPKSTGREYYNLEYIKAHGLSLYNIETISTLTAFTSHAIVFNIKHFVKTPIKRLIVSGGGVKNRMLIAQLSGLLPDIQIIPVEKLGYKYRDIEPMLFSFLGYIGFNKVPINLKHITGSSTAFVPGAIYYP
ncbi:MAG: anhydro-N-acetylmuramic acid kinase [bacterium]